MGLPREGMKHEARMGWARATNEGARGKVNQRLFQGTYQFEGMVSTIVAVSPHFSAWSKATQMTSAEFVGENFAIYRGFIEGQYPDEVDEADLLKDFISELMQNSLDLEVVEGTELTITLTLEDNGTLRWSHDGPSFVGHRPGTGHGDLGALFKIGGTTKRLDFRQYGRFGSGFKRWERHFDTLEIRLRTDGACSTIRAVIGGESHVPCTTLGRGVVVRGEC